MWYLINKSKQQIAKSEQGFVTLEVLIALFIALGFVAVSMQSLVYAMAIKVQAQEKQRANQLIQEDIERINQLGSTALTPITTPSPTPVCDPVATAADATTVPPTPAYTAYENSYANVLWNALQVDSPQGGANTVTNLLRTIESDGSISTEGKQLALRRFHISNSSSNAPHRTLKVSYQVWDWDGTNFTNENGGAITAADEPIAETYVEIIPDVALACP